MTRKSLVRDMAHRAFSLYFGRMENNTQNYIDRLLAVGISLDNASVLVDDFLREHDFDGLASYCAELERLNELAKA